MKGLVSHKRIVIICSSNENFYNKLFVEKLAKRCVYIAYKLCFLTVESLPRYVLAPPLSFPLPEEAFVSLDIPLNYSPIKSRAVTNFSLSITHSGLEVFMV